MNLSHINIKIIENGYVVETVPANYYHNEVYTAPTSFYIQSLDDLVEELDRYTADQ